ncbi:MAG TPA: DUF2244 domain-containing protein [Steroidobacteraceae bacterium]|nr:DUF2244 domain-containing protein [Steroidobacteraceae bacterium]
MQQRIELAPNCSLTPAAARLFFVSISTFSLALALFFAFRGYWPVLPFWGAEMLALGLALRAALRRRLYGQTVLVTDSAVSLLTRSPRGEMKEEFARHWAKVRLRAPSTRLYPSRLTIESRGRALEVGSFLTEDDRCRLAARLRAMVGGMNESPPLDIESTLGDSFR